MSLPRRSLIAGYGCAFVSIGVAIGVKRLLDPILGVQFPFATIFLAVLVTAWYGGLWPAFAANGLGALGSSLFLMSPHGSFPPAGLDQQTGLAIYFGIGIGISLLAGSMHADRARAESAAELAARQAALIEQTYDPVLVWEWNGPIVFWNPGAERLYGFPRKEAMGRVSHALLHTETAGGVETYIGALDREGSWEGELQHVTRDGRAIIVESRMVLIREGQRAYVIEANRNVTERRKAEKSLREANELLETRVRERTADLVENNERLRFSEERSRLIVGSMRTHAIFVLDAVGNIASWNPGAERIEGFKAEEILGRNFSCFYTPEDIESGKPQRALQTAVAEGSFEEEGLRVRRDGSRFWAIVTITPIYDGVPEPIGFVKVVRDITARRAAQGALRDSKETFRLLVDGVKDYAIIMLDPAGKILTWSAGAERIDGYTAEEIVGEHYSRLFTAESIADGEPAQELERAAAEGKVDIEGWRIRKDGSRFWVNGTLAALYGDDGKVQGFAKITRDLTEKRRNDELLRSVLDHTLDAIIGIDERGTISTINRAGEAIFGRAGSEVVGQNVNILMPPPYHEEHDGYLRNYLRTGDAKVIGLGREVRGLRKDGSTFPADLAVTEFQLDNRRHFVGIVRDISERKRLQAQLHQSQKMEAFGQLAGGVAHDFNNLLTVISGYAQMLLAQLPSDDARRKMADEIASAGERAAILTRQLLAFSRQQVFESNLLDLNAVVGDTRNMLRRIIGEDVQLTTLLRPGLSAVKFNAGQIEQIIMNLAVNARDAMPEGGNLTIETREVEIDESFTSRHPETRPGRFVVMAVSDTGCGMTPEVKERIFEPFFTTKPVGKGTGLGLAVVRGIVDQSGGSIDVRSETDAGTTFSIYLPAVQERPSSLPAPFRESSPGGSETILLVEDENSVREFATIALRALGYRVLTASGGEAALQIMASHRDKIDLLMTDVVMPEMSGRKLAETLQASCPGLGVLFMSGYIDDMVVRHGVLQDEVAFLQKPFTSKSLGKKVREVLDRK
jgi:PAS domain S-box-containing protein